MLSKILKLISKRLRLSTVLPSFLKVIFKYFLKIFIDELADGHLYNPDEDEDDD